VQPSLQGALSYTPYTTVPFKGTSMEAGLAAKWLNSRLKNKVGQRLSPVIAHTVQQELAASEQIEALSE